MITLELDGIKLNIPDDLDVKVAGKEVTLSHKYPKYFYNQNIFGQQIGTSPVYPGTITATHKPFGTNY